MVLTELKKLFQPILFLVVVLITVAFYINSLFLISTFFPNGYLVEHYKYSADWQEKYGNSVDNLEMEKAVKEYQQLVEKADNLIATSTLAKPSDMKNYEQLSDWFKQNTGMKPRDQMTQKEEKQMDQAFAIRESLVNEKNELLVPKIEMFEEINERYQRFQSEATFFKESPYTKTEQKKLVSQLFGKDEGWRNLMPNELASVTSTYFQDILILIIVISSLILPAVFVRDRMLGVQKAQWSSRLGRRVVWSQFWATMIGSLIIITVFLGIFGGIFLTTDFVAYFDSGLNSFLADDPMLLSLFSWTYGQLVLLMILLVYLIGLGYASVLFFLSQTSGHYLSLLMKIIPIGFIFIFFANKILSQCFHLKNAVYQFTKIELSELWSGGLIFAIGIGLSVAICMRSKKIDLLV